MSLMLLFVKLVKIFQLSISALDMIWMALFFGIRSLVITPFNMSISHQCGWKKKTALDAYDFKLDAAFMPSALGKMVSCCNPQKFRS